MKPLGEFVIYSIDVPRKHSAETGYYEDDFEHISIKTYGKEGNAVYLSVGAEFAPFVHVGQRLQLIIAEA